MSDKKARSLDRVVEVAMQAFIDRRIDEVSINSIAEQAHCSTATIYEVFGSKEELYRVALARSIEATPSPRVKRVPGEPVLYPLLAYSEQHLRFISSAACSRIDQLMIGNLAISEDIVSRTMDREVTLMRDIISGEVDVCLQHRLFRNISRKSIVYCISACTSYAPLTAGLFYRKPSLAPISDLLDLSFEPLVTPKGRSQLKQYIAERVPN